MEDLIVSVGADITGFLSKIDAAKAKVGQLTENQGQLKAVINDLNTSLRLNEKELTTAAVKLQKLNTTSQEGKTAAANLRKEISALSANSQTLGTSLNTAKTSLASTTSGLKIATTELKDAEKATGGFASGAGKAFGALRTLANIIPGIGIGGLVALIAGPLISAFEKLIPSTSRASQAVKDIASGIHEGGSEFIKASSNVNELTINIDLAKKGFLDKKEVLKQYNDTIGKTTGQVTTLDEAEKALVKNGDAYIQMMLLKAAANFALEAAAKEAFKAEEIRRKKETDFANTVVDTRVATSGLFNAAEFDRETKRIERARKNRKEQAFLDEQGAAYDQLQIAKKFETDAAAISKTFAGGSFFGNAGDKAKTVKSIETISDVIKKVRHDIDDVNQGNADLFGIDKSKENVGVLSSAITHLLDKFKGTSGQQEAIIKFKAEIDEIDLAAKLKQRTTGVGEVAKVVVPLDISAPKPSQLYSTIKKFTVPIIDQFAEMTALLQDSFLNLAEGLGEALGNALSGGGHFLRDALGGVFNIMGNFLVQLGKAAVLTSKLFLAIKASKANPIVGIIGGIAAIVAGTILKNIQLPFAAGGFVSGPGTKTSDSINARLSAGEYVIKADSVSKYGKSFFDMINGGGFSRNNNYANGGPVTSGNIGGGFALAISGEFELRGDRLVAVVSRAEKRIGRNG